MLAIKIFSILVNSMPDERTGSKITWFNSPLRANQDVSTLVNMIQVGQWYGVHKVRGKVITTGADMSLCSLISVSSQPEKGSYKEKRRPTVKFRDIQEDLRPSKLSGSGPLRPHDAHDSDDSDDSEGPNVDRPFPVPQEDAIRVDDDVNLASQFLKNMFVATEPSTSAKAPQCDPALECSFAYDGKAVDWDF